MQIDLMEMVINPLSPLRPLSSLSTTDRRAGKDAVDGFQYLKSIFLSSCFEQALAGKCHLRNRRPEIHSERIVQSQGQLAVGCDLYRCFLSQQRP